MRSLSTLLVASLLSLGACLVQPAGGGPPPVAHPVGPAPEPGATTAELAGMVVDAQTHAPIGRAAIDVVVENVGKYTAQTDASGHFAMSGIEPGTYNLRVRRDGYQPWQTANITLQAGHNQDLDVALVKK